VPSDQVSELALSMIRILHRFPEALKHQAGFVAEKIIQNIRFIFEINIYGAIGDPGLPGDLRYGGFIKTLLGKHLDSGIQYQLILAVGLIRFFLTRNGKTSLYSGRQLSACLKMNIHSVNEDSFINKPNFSLSRKNHPSGGSK